MSNIPLDCGIDTSAKMICCPLQSKASVLASYLACHLGIHLAQFYQIAKTFGCRVQIWEVTWEDGSLQRIYLTESKTLFLCGCWNCFLKIKQIGNLTYLPNQKNPYFMQNERFSFNFLSFFFFFSLNKNIFNRSFSSRPVITASWPKPLCSW